MVTVRDAEQIDVMRQIVGKRIGIRTSSGFPHPDGSSRPTLPATGTIPHMIGQSGEVQLIAALPDQIDQC